MCGVIGVYEPNMDNWNIQEVTGYILRDVDADDATPEQIWLMNKVGYRRCKSLGQRYHWERMNKLSDVQRINDV